MTARRAAERNAAERNKKLLLAGLALVLVAVLAYELPPLLHRSSSSSTASTPAVTTTATPATTGGATQNLADTSTRSSALLPLALRRAKATDPFVPLVKRSPSTSSSPKPSGKPATPSVRDTRPLVVSVSPHANAAAGKPVQLAPAQVKPALPTAAVIWTNGKQQIVGLAQDFTVGDVELRLAGVTRETVRIKVLGGLFAGGKQVITVGKGQPLRLANTATGVEYRLLFTGGTTAATTATSR
jgi:hypothetical protein